MLLSPINEFLFKVNNQGATPSATPGTSVVPGASSAEGSWTEILSAANMAKDCYLLILNIYGNATSATDKSQVIDLGIDPAGGTSYTALFNDFVIGSLGGFLNMAQVALPVFIPAGASVAVRIKGLAATAGTTRVLAYAYGRPTMPEIIPKGQVFEIIGAVGGSQKGVTFTPGNGAESSWVTLGTTVNDLWAFFLGIGFGSSAATASNAYVDLAYGDATNKIMLIEDMVVNLSAAENIINFCPDMTAPIYRKVPAGSTLYIRGQGTAASQSLNANVLGIGG